MICENCDNEHEGNYGSGRFCCEKCARGFSTKQNREEINRKVSLSLGGNGLPKNKKCLYCKIDLTSRREKFCSTQCQQNFYRDDKHKLWESKKEFPSQFQARKYLLYKFGNICMLCGVETWQQQKVPLVLDHINGNSDDHSFDNVRLICRNCDGLLPTYCNKNKGNGGKRSKKRLQNYKNGSKKW